MSLQPEYADESLNPLDSVEEVLNAHNWAFSRMNEDELFVSVTSRNGEYRLFFIWQEELSAVQLCCQYDLSINSANAQIAPSVLMNINENLWAGHFDIPASTQRPSFRHTCLLRGFAQNANIDIIEDMVDICLAQCERYYGVFHLLAQEQPITPENVSLAMMETSGRS